jgi:hypothetical protein
MEWLGALVVDLAGHFLEPGARVSLCLEQPGRPLGGRDIANRRKALRAFSLRPMTASGPLFSVAV